MDDGENTPEEIRDAASQAIKELHHLSSPASVAQASTLVVATVLLSYSSDPLGSADFFHEQLRAAIARGLPPTH